MKTIYKDAVSKVIEACKIYKGGGISIQDLQNLLWQVGDDVSNANEPWLRNLLHDTESKLEFARFSTNKEDLPKKLGMLIDDLMRILTNAIL